MKNILLIIFGFAFIILSVIAVNQEHTIEQYKKKTTVSEQKLHAITSEYNYNRGVLRNTVILIDDKRIGSKAMKDLIKITLVATDYNWNNSKKDSIDTVHKIEAAHLMYRIYAEQFGKEVYIKPKQ